MDEHVEEYWFTYYLDDHCTLCGNRGIIDSRASAITPAGYRVGRLNFCICPNGQALREYEADIEKEFAGRPPRRTKPPSSPDSGL